MARQVRDRMSVKKVTIWLIVFADKGLEGGGEWESTKARADAIAAEYRENGKPANVYPAIIEVPV